MAYDSTGTNVAVQAEVGRAVIAASDLTGRRVRNTAGDDLGAVEEIMLDPDSGDIAYAVLSFGGFLGMGSKLFAVPWAALEMAGSESDEFILDVDKTQLENAPGFDKDNWPNMADPTFGSMIHSHYGVEPRTRTTVYDRPFETGAGVRTDDVIDDARRERVNSPDLPETHRVHPQDVFNFPGSSKDADLKTADPSREYAPNSPNRKIGE